MTVEIIVTIVNVERIVDVLLPPIDSPLINMKLYQNTLLLTRCPADCGAGVGIEYSARGTASHAGTGNHCGQSQ
ncbi:MAG: hypothetical protein R2867_16080 [Caldilineaceae bacterium]